MTSFIAVCIREGETLEQSGSQAIASKVVDCKYSVQFAYVFYTLHIIGHLFNHQPGQNGIWMISLI